MSDALRDVGELAEGAMNIVAASIADLMEQVADLPNSNKQPADKVLRALAAEIRQQYGAPLPIPPEEA